MLLLPARDRQSPATAIGARFSIPFAFASALLHGAPTLRSFAPERLADADVRALAARIALDRVGHDLTPGVRLAMRDGEVLDRAASEPPALLAGATSFAAIRPKLADCLEAAGGGLAANRLVQAVSELGPESDVDFRLLLSADPAGARA